MTGQFLAAALALLCSAATTPAVQPPLTPDGWGPLRIGMTRAEVIAAVGDAEDRDMVGPGEVCDEFHPARAPEGLFVMLEEDRLTRLSLSEGATTLRTDHGFGIGDREAAIRAAYGAAIRVTPHAYEGPEAHYLTAWARGRIAGEDVEDPAARGIRYETDPQGAVRTVHAGGPSIQYIESCA